MKTVLNIIWLIFAGWELFLGYIIAGVIACIFIVTIPVGVASFRIAFFVLWPFGREVVKKPGAGAGSAIMNFLWFIIAGWWLTLGHIITGVIMCLTIIGIPLGIASFRLIPITCFPYGKEVVTAPHGQGFPD